MWMYGCVSQWILIFCGWWVGDPRINLYYGIATVVSSDIVSMTCLPLVPSMNDHFMVSTSNLGIAPSTATYQCASGWQTTDTLTRFCNLTINHDVPVGFWQGTPPTCTGSSLPLLFVSSLSFS